METTALTDEQWRAIERNDAAYDGTFWYAVRTTGIFCRPSCKSRLPRREHATAFLRLEHALAARYRPCKRCKPTAGRAPDEETAERIAAYLRARFDRPLKLDSIAATMFASPFHLHRVYKRVTGKTVGESLQELRLEEAKKRLAGTDAAIAEIAVGVGIGSAAYFATWFKRRTGATPAAYRELHRAGPRREEGMQG